MLKGVPFACVASSFQKQTSNNDRSCSTALKLNFKPGGKLTNLTEMLPISAGSIFNHLQNVSNGSKPPKGSRIHFLTPSTALFNKSSRTTPDLLGHLTTSMTINDTLWDTQRGVCREHQCALRIWAPLQKDNSDFPTLRLSFILTSFIFFFVCW